MSKLIGIKEATKRFWNWLWHSESWLSYVIFLVIAFIIIKWIFLPVLGIALGSSMPLAIVESCSMYHEGNLFSNYEEWFNKHETKYEEYNIDGGDFYNFKFKKGLNKGDIIVLVKAEPEKLEIGDVILFDAGQKRPVIHRIIKTEYQDGEYSFSTIGDNNPQQLPGGIENNIQPEQIIGKTAFKAIPYAGWGKLIFFEFTQPESNKGFCDEN